jgi:phosphate transport system substrate-binding protein
MRALVTSTLVVGLVFSLSACTPPMPPEVRIALEEQQYICEDGITTVNFPEAISDIATDFSDSISGACGGMQLTLPESGQSAQIEFSSNGTFNCTPFATVPFAVDGALIIVNQPDLGSLNLDLDTASKIFDGKITTWNDPAIAELNVDQELPESPISVFPAVATEALDAIKNWAKSSGVTFTGSLLKSTDTFSAKDAEKIQDNEIAIFPYSVNMQTGLISATIVPGPGHLEAQALSESANLTSGSSQWVASATETEVSVALNPKLKPVAPEGSDTAPIPYQAIYPVQMALCGEDNLVTRATARFLLRQDSQGSLGASNLISLPEPIRVQAIELVAVGLPKIKIEEPAN